jgi:hypothetical protein
MKNSTKKAAAKSEERPFSFVSSDDKHIVIAFNVDGEKFEKRLDIRYVPTNDVNEFTEFCEKYIESYRAGKVAEQDQVAVSDEIKALA